MACAEDDCGYQIDDAATIANTVTQLLDPDGLGNCGAGQIPMGLGPLGNGSTVFKRKFRWTAEIAYCCESGDPKVVPSTFVKMGARPHLTIDEQEVNFLNGVTWIPGKGKWQTINFTFYDVGGPSNSDTSAPLLGWLASVYDFSDPVCLTMGSKTGDYTGTVRLTLYDGCGQPIEAWLLKNAWPTDVDWGDLDMESSDICMIAITLRYTNVCYKSFCPESEIDKCPCTPCENGG